MAQTINVLMTTQYTQCNLSGDRHENGREAGRKQKVDRQHTKISNSYIHITAHISWTEVMRRLWHVPRRQQITDAELVLVFSWRHRVHESTIFYLLPLIRDDFSCLRGRCKDTLPPHSSFHQHLHHHVTASYPASSSRPRSTAHTQRRTPAPAPSRGTIALGT